MNLTIITYDKNGGSDFMAFFVTPDEDITIEVGSEVKILGKSNHAVDEPIPVITEVPAELGLVLWSDAITLYPITAASNQE